MPLRVETHCVSLAFGQSVVSKRCSESVVDGLEEGESPFVDLFGTYLLICGELVGPVT
jgi:hypothetical protein